MSTKHEVEQFLSEGDADRASPDSPRTNPDVAYRVFMSMPQAEWLGLVASLAQGGVLTPAEEVGFRRALEDRKAKAVAATAPLADAFASKMPAYIQPAKRKEATLAAESEKAALGIQLMTLKARKEELAVQTTDNNKAIEECEAKLATLMVEEGLDLFRVPGVGTFSTGPQVHCSVKAGMGDELVEWLDAEGMGAMAKRSVHPSTLKAWASSRLQSNEPLPPMLHVYIATRINTRKAG